VREIRHWIDQLVGQDLLRVTSGPYPTLFLTQAGADVLRGLREVVLFALPVPSRAPKKKAALAELAATAGAPPPDEGLFERLRTLRRRLAAERAVPPYLIFSDRSLAHMASARPTTPEEFLAIKGVGEKKAADLGPVFLAEIGAWRALDGAR
jgi:ATP-dependent DNA helicase RecQ